MKLVRLAAKNAEASFGSRRGQDADAASLLEKLRARLGLRRIPRRIECFDIAHLMGAATVASMVVFVDGEPDKASYRRFRVKTATNDDFAAMYEVLSRRFRRAAAGDPRWQEPDLLVVDGGKGQLSTALAALRDLGVEVGGEQGLDVIGLAKERLAAEAAPEAAAARTAAVTAAADRPDRVFLRNAKDPIHLRPSSTELFLLARLRDEAHRFANTYHRDLRKRRALRSVLEDIPGVGERRRKILLRHFGSVKRVKAASVEELAAAPGMTRAAAEAVRRFFGAAEPA